MPHFKLWKYMIKKCSPVIHFKQMVEIIIRRETDLPWYIFCVFPLIWWDLKRPFPLKFVRLPTFKWNFNVYWFLIMEYVRFYFYISVCFTRLKQRIHVATGASAVLCISRSAGFVADVKSFVQYSQVRFDFFLRILKPTWETIIRDYFWRMEK